MTPKREPKMSASYIGNGCLANAATGGNGMSALVA